MPGAETNNRFHNFSVPCSSQQKLTLTRHGHRSNMQQLSPSPQ
jgi:hypothetical protein